MKVKESVNEIIQLSSKNLETLDFLMADRCLKYTEKNKCM